MDNVEQHIHEIDIEYDEMSPSKINHDLIECFRKFYANDKDILFNLISNMKNIGARWFFLGSFYEINKDVDKMIECYENGSKFEMTEDVEQVEDLVHHQTNSTQRLAEILMDSKMCPQNKTKALSLFSQLYDPITFMEIYGGEITENLFENVKLQYENTKTIQTLHENNENLIKQNEELQKRVIELETEIAYSPDGNGYQECKKHFEELVSKKMKIEHID